MAALPIRERLSDAWDSDLDLAFLDSIPQLVYMWGLGGWRRPFLVNSVGFRIEFQGKKHSRTQEKVIQHGD